MGGRLDRQASNLPTDKLVLVSQAGFTTQARLLAERNGAVPLEPSDLAGDDPSGRIVNRLKSIWPKIVSFTPERAQVTVQRPDGEKWFKAPADLWLFLDDGTQLGTLVEWCAGVVTVSWDKIIEDIGLRDIPETIDRYFTLDVGNPALGIDNVRRSLFVRYEDAEPGSELHRVVHVRVVGKAHIEVAEVALSHHRLGDVIFSQGTSTIGSRNALIVVTEDEQGGQLSIRFGDEVADDDSEDSSH